MNGSRIDTAPVLDEQVWREWAHKGKLRDQMKGRKRRKAFVVGMSLIAMAAVVYLFLMRISGTAI